MTVVGTEIVANMKLYHYIMSFMANAHANDFLEVFNFYVRNM